MPNTNSESFDLDSHDGRSVMPYFLTGMAVGLLIGSAAGVLFAPKPGSEMRTELAHKYGEVKGKVNQWVEERKHQAKDAAERVGSELNV